MSDAPRSYDRLMAALDGIPDGARSRPTTVRVITPLLGNVETFVVQTFREKEAGDTIFVEHNGPDGFERYYLPPAVVRVLLRQRESLEAQIRRRIGRQQAAERKAAGIKPFQRRGGDAC